MNVAHQTLFTGDNLDSQVKYINPYYLLRWQTLQRLLLRIQ